MTKERFSCDKEGNFYNGGTIPLGQNGETITVDSEDAPGEDHDKLWHSK